MSTLKFANRDPITRKFGAQFNSEGVPGPMGPLALGAPLVGSGNSYSSPLVGAAGAHDYRTTYWGVPPAMFEEIGWPWTLTLDGWKAVSGTTSTQILAQTTAALATLPVGTTDGLLCIFERFLNDVNAAKTAVQGRDDAIADIVKARAAKVRSLIGTCPPFKSTNGFSAAVKQKRIDYSDFIRLLAARDVGVLDWDVIYAQAGITDADYADDIHLNTRGFEKLAKWIKAYLVSINWLPAGDATTIPATNYSQNTGFTGGAVTGPANYSAWAMGAAGGALQAWNTATQEARFTGTPVGAVGTLVAILQQLTGTGSPNAPLNVEAVLKLQMPAATAGLLGIEVQHNFYDSGFGTNAAGYASIYSPGVAETATSMAKTPGSIQIMRAPTVSLLAGTVVYKIASHNIKFLAIGGPIDFILKFIYGTLRSIN